MLSTDSGDGVIVARIGTTVSEIPNLDVKGVLPELVLKDVEEGEISPQKDYLGSLIPKSFRNEWILEINQTCLIAEDVEETARALKAGFNFVQNMVSPRVRRS